MTSFSLNNRDNEPFENSGSSILQHDLTVWKDRKPENEKFSDWPFGLDYSIERISVDYQLAIVEGYGFLKNFYEKHYCNLPLYDLSIGIVNPALNHDLALAWANPSLRMIAFNSAIERQYPALKGFEISSLIKPNFDEIFLLSVMAHELFHVHGLTSRDHPGIAEGLVRVFSESEKRGACGLEEYMAYTIGGVVFEHYGFELGYMETPPNDPGFEYVLPIQTSWDNQMLEFIDSRLADSYFEIGEIDSSSVKIIIRAPLAFLSSTTYDQELTQAPFTKANLDCLAADILFPNDSWHDDVKNFQSLLLNAQCSLEGLAEFEDFLQHVIGEEAKEFLLYDFPICGIGRRTPLRIGIQWVFLNALKEDNLNRDKIVKELKTLWRQR